MTPVPAAGIQHGPLAGLDLEDWLPRFHVRYVKRLPDDLVAVNSLTTWGRKHGLGEWEIVMLESFRPWTDFLLLHEGVENWLRRQGWKYAPSHDVATAAEEEAFAGTPRYDAFLRALDGA